MKRKILPLLAVTASLSLMGCTRETTVTTEPEPLEISTGLEITTHSYYAKTAVVTNLETETDTVICEDATGNIWAFYRIEDWQTGDICSLLMDNCNTEEITDDIIVSVRYSGVVADYETETK